MSDPEKELYTYLLNLSRVRASVLTFLSGFTFTVISIFLNQIPDVASSMSQITLFFLTLLFELFLFLLAWQIIIITACAPARITHEAAAHAFKAEATIFNYLMFLGFGLWGLSVMLMFLLWNLLYLTLASGTVWVVVLIAALSILRRQIRRIRASVHPETHKGN